MIVNLNHLIYAMLILSVKCKDQKEQVDHQITSPPGYEVYYASNDGQSNYDSGYFQDDLVVPSASIQSSSIWNNQYYEPYPKDYYHYKEDPLQYKKKNHKAKEKALFEKIGLDKSDLEDFSEVAINVLLFLGIILSLGAGGMLLISFLTTLQSPYVLTNVANTGRKRRDITLNSITEKFTEGVASFMKNYKIK